MNDESLWFVPKNQVQGLSRHFIIIPDELEQRIQDEPLIF